MQTQEAVKSIRAADSVPRRRKIAPGAVGWFVILASLGAVAALYPFYALGGVVVALAVLGGGWLALRYLRKAGLQPWQMLLLLALSGYLLLNYGFENLSVHLGGIPIIISYVLMFSSLGLAVYSHPGQMGTVRKEPAIFFLLILFVLACLHLIVDVPKYGIWALRDASMCFDPVFIILGLLWARRKDSIAPLMKWLMVVFLFNALYSLTFPWQERISEWSPTSGVFLQIPLFGNYRGNFLFLGLGALFYLFLSRYTVKWPRWIILFFAFVQLFGLAILQARQMYVALLAILVLLAVIGETRKSGKLLLVLAAPVVAVVLLTVIGVQIPGRIGPVTADFFVEHFRSISGAQGTPGATVQGRVEWYDEVFARIRNNPWLGEGFGQPLITFENDQTGGVVRQPHNSSVTVLARLGIVGLLPWLLFHLYVLTRFVHAFRQRSRLNRESADFILWLFMVYVVYMISALVEPTFEFPSGAIPFYFFLGLSLGLIRWQIPVSAEKPVPERAGMRLESPALL